MVTLEEKLAPKLARDKLPVLPKTGAFALLAGGIRNTLGFLLCVAVALVVIEFVFALAHVGEDTVARPDALRGYAQLENQFVTFRSEGYSRFKINSRGFRDREFAVPKPAGIERVCMIGDSLTLGMEVPLEKTFSKLLEKRLQSEGRNIEVLNCGMAGTGTGQQLLAYRHDIAQLKPDILILAYHLGDNDDNVGGGTVPPRPTFELSSGNHLSVNYHDVDKWLASDDARFYTSLDWLRRNWRLLAVLNKLDTDLRGDATYKAISKIVSKPSSLVWSCMLRCLPRGNWNVNSSRLVASDMLSAENSSSPALAINNKQVLTVAPALCRGALNAPVSTTRTPALKPVTPAQSQAQAVFHGSDLEAYKGLLAMHQSRMAVTTEIIRRLNRECNNNHCRLFVVALPAYDNSMMYYREVNELGQLASEEHFGFLNTCSAYPRRGPLDDSPFHFAIHFNRAGHLRMYEQIYSALFSKSAPNS